jgi:release factor glutamine methyltransferase
MLLSDIRNKYKHSLSAIYPPEEIDSLFTIAVEFCMELDRFSMLRDMNKNTSTDSENKMFDVLTRLTKAEPIQYITGVTEFYNIKLKINSSVIIPRQETEYLTDIIIKRNQGTRSLRIIDLCTGSGCIAVALAKNLPGSLITAVDLSMDAVRLAEENAEVNEQKITVIRDDLLAPTSDYSKFDILVSNPPYVRKSEKAMMHPNVLNYEPHKALFVDDEDPLVFYRALAKFAIKHVSKPLGKLYLEINQYLGKETQKLFKDFGFMDVSVIKDLNDNERYIECIMGNMENLTYEKKKNKS